MKPPVIIGGIAAPDSELVRAAAALVEQAHSKPFLNHVHRTWWFAEFIGKKRQMKYDRELVYLASLLHDPLAFGHARSGTSAYFFRRTPTVFFGPRR